MKKIIFVIIIALVTSCSYLKDTMKIDEVVQGKKRYDKSKNLAEKYLIKKELSEKYVEIDNVLVKNIIDSNNVDYRFCIIADEKTPEGDVECYIYTSEIKIISKLVKGKSRISVKGDFGRFFSLLDDYYTKIEIYKSSIVILDSEEVLNKKIEVEKNEVEKIETKKIEKENIKEEE